MKLLKFVPTWSPIVATLSLRTGRTTVMQGTAHLVIFAVSLFTTTVP